MLIRMRSLSIRTTHRIKALTSESVFSSRCTMLTSWPEDRLKAEKLPKAHKKGKGLTNSRLTGLRRGILRIKETVWRVPTDSRIWQTSHNSSTALTETKQLTILAGQRPANTIPCQCTTQGCLSWRSATTFSLLRYKQDSAFLIPSELHPESKNIQLELRT